jgi:subtilisin family serine protease
MRVALLVAVSLASATAADPQYLVRAPNDAVRHLLDKGAVVSLVRRSRGRDLYTVRLPNAAPHKALDTILAETGVSVENDSQISIPEISVASANAPLSYSTVHAKLQALVHDILTGQCVTGPSTFRGYLCQPAVGIINLPLGRMFATGKGIVGVLDTGIDETHPALAGSVMPGWDFVKNAAGGYITVADMQSTTSILDAEQSTTSILDQSTTSILDQSTTSILDVDQSTTSILDSRPKNFLGHGTMVAGMIHLVAPGALLMPIKVFGADGTASLSQILNGIYYAADHGVKILNMSFDMTAPSSELNKAIDYAAGRGMILVAAAGNEGRNMSVYPAGLQSVIGVAATNDDNIREVYSNYGPVVSLAAPDGVITTYPGNRWALAYGTSLSAPEVSGGIALLVQMFPNLDWEAATGAITQCAPIGQQLGAGRLDLFRACSWQASHFVHWPN